MNPSNAPPPPLQSILLTIRTPRGPRLPFHYPPHAPNSTGTTELNGSSRKGRSTSVSSTSSTSSWDASGSNSGSDSDSRADGTVVTAGTDDEDGRASSSHTSRTARRDYGIQGTGTVGSSRRAGGGGSSGRRMEVDDEEDDTGSDGQSSGQSDAGHRRRVNTRRTGGRNGASVGADAEMTPVGGFDAGSLAKLLSPGRAFHKRKFEIAVDACVFVGCPMFVRENGEWGKKRRKAKKPVDVRNEQGDASGNGDTQQPENNGGHVNEEGESHLEQQDGGVVDVDEGIEVSDEAKQPSREHLEEHHISGVEPSRGQGLDSGAVSDAGTDAKSTSTNGGGNDMTMFNIVFVMRPQPLEYQERTGEMYDNVVRKFAKALKHEQARSDYVWKEAKAIMNMRDKARESKAPASSVWPRIIAQSSLAKAIAIIYDSISSSKIAHINLNGSFDTSFQIPQAIYTPYVPTPAEPQRPGLWLTTAAVMDDDGLDPIPNEHSALLLLEDAATLLKEIESDATELSAPLAFFVRNSTPRKSLKKLSVTCSISLPDLQIFARHLIYWRRARAIPPLHSRYTYMVSPNADMRALTSAIPAYAARFPTLPSLPKMLSVLSSGTPKTYGSFFPSKDHGPAYMDILAWLMRGGWVTQLRTFAWVRVPVDVKVEVDVILEREAREKEERKREKERDDASSGSRKPSSTRESPVGTRNVIPSPSSAVRTTSSGELELDWATPSATSRHSPRRNGDKEASPQLSTHLSPPRPASDAGSSSSRHTAIPLTLTSPSPPSTPVTSSQQQDPPQQSMPSPQPHPQLPRPSPLHKTHTATSGTLPTSNQHASPQATGKSDSTKPRGPHTPSLVHSPHHANALESRWLERIGTAHLSDPDARELWPTLLRYFDGRHALEEVAVREGLKRKRIAAAMAALREGGWLVVVRHW